MDIPAEIAAAITAAMSNPSDIHCILVEDPGSN